MGQSVSATTALSELELTSTSRIRALDRLDLRYVGDLLRHYPKRYEDRSKFAPFPDAASDVPVCLIGEVVSTAVKRFGRRRGAYEITLEASSGSVFSQPIVCRWFNMLYLQKVVVSGHSLVVYGKPKARGRQIIIDHPEYEILDDTDTPSSSLHLGRVVPIHPAGEGLTPRVLRELIHEVIDLWDGAGLGLLDPSQGGPSPRSFRQIHFPESFEELSEARTQLALDEAYGMQLVVQTRKRLWENNGPSRCGSGELVAQVLDSLPFQLTSAQETVIEEIKADLASPSRMHRLLQGDVGSGKTIVALLAMVCCIEAGFDALLMAPTQILAEQHYRTFSRMLEPLGVTVNLLTSAQHVEPTPLFDQYPPITIGTHALLYDMSVREKVGLVVIDEQHKFGVAQRAALVDLPQSPDALVMTATPIPRTLAQTVYGDLDVSTIDQKPSGRGRLVTGVRESKKLPDAAEFLKKQLDQGRQAYIVYALIDESEKLSAKAASAEISKWRNLLNPHEVGLLHGRTPGEERELVMSRFRSNKLPVLVSTTVIEVGVDVPNATVLIVENAERFGLAQLHQLRGRIGRGAETSYCILLHTLKAGDTGLERLGVLEQTGNGFEVAEADLRLRGPGNVLGTEQAGLPPLKLLEEALSPGTLTRAISLARETLEQDPELTSDQRLREYVDRSLERFSTAVA